MGNYNFKKDLVASEESVDRVIEHLESKGCSDIWKNNDGRFDICYISPKGEERTAEVKNDLMWDSTGNVAIEYTSRNKASGIAKSKADVWFYVLDSIYVADTAEIRAYLIQHWDRYRRVKGGDDKTSDLALLKIQDFKDIFKQVT